MKLDCLILALFVLGGATHAWADEKTAGSPVELRALVDKAVATTGDIITYTVELEHEPQVDVTLPELGGMIAGLRVIDAGGEDKVTKTGRKLIKKWYSLRADLVGSYILPPVKVEYLAPKVAADQKELGDKLTAQTSEIFIEVQSVLPKDGSAADIRDIKPLIPLKTGFPRWAWALAAGLILVSLGGGYYLWRRRHRHRSILPTPAHEIAFAALDSLRQTNFDDLAAVREYTFKISEVLRNYIEAVYPLNATDLTTEEILARFSSLTGLSGEEQASLKGFLNTTDRIKFAEYVPNSADIENVYEAALGFVEKTSQKAAKAVGAEVG